jgi:hypothetical protein
MHRGKAMTVDIRLERLLQHPAFVSLGNVDEERTFPPTLLLTMEDPTGAVWQRIGSLTSLIQQAYDELPLEG